ncbi:MAG: hypothetical protein WBK24_02230 [Dethiobacteria bacterium]|nr:hypothetical protein [Bacillota bacterium]HOJ84120.1 hypothetical protein [Bacillota bacterium]HOL15294.1 hypothetical protein [Bacillota bacterium]
MAAQTRAGKQFKCRLLTPGQVEELGMVCGGDVVLYLQYIAAADSRIHSLVDSISPCTTGRWRRWRPL